MRTHIFLATVATVCGLLASTLVQAQPAAVQAQPAAPVTRDALVPGRDTQRIEHIQHEDAGSRVNELRVGGETRSISVQPKAGVPGYDVRPADASGTAAGSREAGPGSAGPRVWKLHQF